MKGHDNNALVHLSSALKMYILNQLLRMSNCVLREHTIFCQSSNLFGFV